MLVSYFFGACASEGFCSYARELFGRGDRVLIIKGGPGCGKSTFMRAVAKEAERRGLDAETILCSSDPDSLDGVRVPALGFAIADGTSPHVLEPELCGGSENYVNFGTFYDAEAMRKVEEEIRTVQRENAACYRHVTACLSAADRLGDSIRALTDELPAIRGELDELAQCLSRSVLRPTGQTGDVRRCFLAAATPRGITVCVQTPPALCGRVYVLHDEYGLAPHILQTLRDRAAALGHTCLAGYTPLQAKGAPAYLLLPQADTAFVSESSLFGYDGPCFCRIDLDSTVHPRLRQELEYCVQTRASLLERAAEHMRHAKSLHDRIERLCSPFVDFAGIDALTKKTLAYLFGEK